MAKQYQPGDTSTAGPPEAGDYSSPQLDSFDKDMEALNSASLGTMGSLLRKLDDLARTEDWARRLRDDLGSISAKQAQILEVDDPSLTVNYWMKDVRELSYDMEDCVDQFVHADDADAKMAWINDLLGFRTRMEEVRERYDRYKLEFGLSHPTTAARHRFRTVYEEPEPVIPVGMNGPTNELLGWLKPNGDDGEEQLKVVSILGVEGVGKSMLAQKLWHELGGQFDCQAFVQTAKKPDMRMILRSILSQIRLQQLPEACQVPNLIHDIRNHLQDKSYFFIIDDLWAVSVWDVLSRSFPVGNPCSRIITTTTNEDVALACCSYDPEHIFTIKPLGADHSKQLFINRAFGYAKGCPQQFNDVSDDITRKCGGLPLAIICIATLVECQPETVEQWKFVQNFLHHNLRTNSSFEEILKQVLKLSYSSLPHCLKTCLLYLSVYPENYLFLKDDLVKQWIAEEFICTTEGKDIVEVASSYFDKLLSLGLIQRMDTSSNKKGLSYVVHPAVFDFITCKSMEDNFITIIDYSQSAVALTDKVRRLSLHFGSATYATTPASIGLSQVRSLIFMGLLNCMPSLVEFKLVRVVILQFWGDHGDTSFPLTGICGLLLLRYLQVRCNIIVELPAQMGCLKHLETLEIHAKVASVPSDIFLLPRLLHLRLGRKRYHCHKHLILSYLPSGNALPLDDSSRASSHPLPIFEFPGMIPRPPRWIGHFGNLRYLDVVVRELQTYDVDVLAELWALTALSLYVRTPTAGVIHFERGAFPALKYFKYMCGALLLAFDKEAMPNLWRLNVGFNAHRGGKYGHMLSGIEHLLNLQEIAASIGAAFGAEESDRRTAESVFQNAISKHPCLPSFKVKRFDRVDGEYDLAEKQNWIQEIEFSNERDEALKKQHGAHKEDWSNDQPGVLGKTSGEDMKKCADTGDGQQQTQALEKARSLLLLVTTLTATITYQAGLNPPGGLWQDDGNWHNAGDPILLTTSPRRYKEFFYCNSVAFVASLVVILVLMRVLLEYHTLEASMILGLFGLISAYAAGSCRDVSSSIYYVMALAGAVLVYVVIHAVFLKLDQRDINGRGNDEVTLRKVKEDHELMEKRLNWLFFFANLKVTIAFNGGLTPQSGFWLQNDVSGLHAGVPVLDNYLHRYETFLYWNSVSFMLSIVLIIILLVRRNLYRSAIRNNALSVCTAAGMCSLMGAYAAGSSQHLKTSTFIFGLVAVVMSSVVFLVLSSKNTGDVENVKASDPMHKYLMLLGILASVTYLAPLGEVWLLVTSLAGIAPPGGVWQGDGGSHAAGNPVMDWYLVFFCGNFISFVASIVIIIVLLLRPSLHHRKRSLGVINTMIVLDLLGLLVAYAASSSWSWMTFGSRSHLVTNLNLAVLAVLAYSAVHVCDAGTTTIKKVISVD